ncbi:Ku protein [Vitiosangium sp. GDMCC 1.1324]|uniref:non-homologous end joining protein Ku n=1 Tax=Vitiosangium sp. (strain GDMCC 1.1324) TaxID=2138576 RepID=UPI000D3948B9|nr:Ku protein [Vitiosangium sp. GDMCC 1.1324]PTL83830.1 Ku protein [Vitiosangium sp. GDMCC 1.1324]
MSRPVWTGSLGFGHMNVPVRLHGAVSPRQVQFNFLHDADGARIQQKRVCSADGEEVPFEHVVKGYEIRPGRYVEVTRGELEALDPQASRTVELEDFVELSEIDPILFDTTYHVMPGENAWKPFATLAMALRASGRAGIGRLVMHQKGHLCVVWPHGRGLVLSTLHYADELLSQDSFPEVAVPGPRPDEREVEAVLSAIEARTVDFEPQRYHDTYRERLLAFLERRARAEGMRELPPEEAPAREEEEAPRVSRAGRATRRAPEAVRGEEGGASSRGVLRLRPQQQAAREVRKRTPRAKKTARTPARTRRKKGSPGR